MFELYHLNSNGLRLTPLSKTNKLETARLERDAIHAEMRKKGFRSVAILILMPTDHEVVREESFKSYHVINKDDMMFAQAVQSFEYASRMAALLIRSGHGSFAIYARYE